MIIKTSPNFRKSNFLLIFNNQNDLLAIAQSKVEFSDLEQLRPKDEVAFNLSDKGYYLREKQ
jgi:hypothetical protein